MQEYVLKVSSIYPENLNSLQNIILIPASIKYNPLNFIINFSIISAANVVQNNLSILNINTTLSNNKLSVRLKNSNSGYVYNIPITGITYTTGDTVGVISCALTAESIFNDIPDLIDVEYNGVINSISIDMVDRLEIKVVEQNTLQYSSHYQTGSVKVLEPNLLSDRIRLAMASWSSANNNELSNYMKVLSIQHDVFENVTYKLNDALKMAYDQTYVPQVFENVLLNARPNSITNLSLGGIEVVEASSIQRSIQNVTINHFDSTDGNLVEVYIPTLHNSALLINSLAAINSILTSKLYLRHFNKDVPEFATCVVHGLDEKNKSVIETLILRTGAYSESHNRFSKVYKIECNSDIIVANYVDFSHTHYVDSSTYITPPVVNSSKASFFPSVNLISNVSGNNTLLVLQDDLKLNWENTYTFDLNSQDVTSLYLMQDNSVMWTTKSGLVNTFNFSKLSIDFTKKTGNNTSTNANNYILVDNTNTAIGDWADITVNAADWFKTSGDTSFLIQCINKDTILYYDPITGSLGSDLAIIYPNLSFDTIDFSILIQNQESYIFNIIPNDVNGRKYTALTHSNLVTPYTKYVQNGTLFLIDGEVRILNATTSSTSNIEIPSGYSSYIELTSNGGTLLYNVTSNNFTYGQNNINNSNDYVIQYIADEFESGKTILFLSDNLIISNNLELKLGVGFSQYEVNASSTFSCSYKIVSPTDTHSGVLNPHLYLSNVDNYELTINIPTGSAITTTINTGY